MRAARRGIAGTLALLSLATAYATSRRSPGLRADGDPELPARLSETGLYEPDRPFAVRAENRAFSPQYPLWSDGAVKRRWIYLPPGTRIDAGRLDAWDFPVGTRFWKEFAFGGRTVETRMLWKVAPGRWSFASYAWNDEQTDAELAPEVGVRGVVEVAPGRRHSIPSRADCVACHGSPGRPLGFGALQLSPDRDPNAIHGEPLAPAMLTLDTLVEEGRLEGAPPTLLADPPRIRASSPRTRAALGYLAANCGGCHNQTGEISANVPSLAYADVMAGADAVAESLVGRATRFQVPGVAEGASVVVDPLAPAQSALLCRMRSRRPSSQMPPLGTVVSDTQALDAIAEWIDKDLAPQATASAAPPAPRN
jgi:cytochrome c553